LPSRITTFATALLFCQLSQLLTVAHGQEKFPGLFHLSIESKNPKLIPSQNTVLAINEDDKKLIAIDLRNPNTLLSGIRSGGTGELQFDLVNPEGKTIRARMKWAVGQKKFEGSLDTKDLVLPWEAKATSSAWYCGNHNPAHVAFTSQDVADCTKKHGCKSWRQVTAEKVSEFIKSKMDEQEKKSSWDR
jgi:hypothetical protein